MKRKRRLQIGMACIFIGFVVAIGSAGALECGSIGARQAIIQMAAGLVLVIGGGFGGGVFG